MRLLQPLEDRETLGQHPIISDQRRHEMLPVDGVVRVGALDALEQVHRDVVVGEALQREADADAVRRRGAPIAVQGQRHRQVLTLRHPGQAAERRRAGAGRAGSQPKLQLGGGASDPGSPLRCARGDGFR